MSDKANEKGIVYKPEETPAVFKSEDVPMYKVRVTIVKAHPGCGAQHKEGDIYEEWMVTKGSQKGFICPTAYATLFPWIYALRYGAVFPWGEGPGNSMVLCCPDVETPVHFKIERVTEETEGK
jgi:uncharacterized repeat protein (TIGR04076 family)